MRSNKLKKALIAIPALLVIAWSALLLANMGYELPMETMEQTSDRNRTVAIFGATGTVGDGLLKAAMNDSSIEKIHVVTRRPTARIEEGVASGKVVMTIHKDYLDYAPIQDLFADVDAAYWAIGLSAVGLDEETYREIHFDFPARFITAWLEVARQQDLSFHYVSGSGAKADSRMMWAREKADAEAQLTRLAEPAGLRVYSYRPAFIYPTESEANFGHGILNAIFKPIGFSVAAESIGDAMIEVTERSEGITTGTVFENRDIGLLGDAHEKRRAR